MADAHPTPAVDLQDLSVEDAFAVLGDETRLNIVRVLWKAGAIHEYDDLDDSATDIAFSDLRRRVDVDDNGKFNYHLSKLRPHFVRRTDDGYRLCAAGKKLARTVVAISGDPTPTVTGDVSTECPVCGGTVTATYEDQWLRFACRECDGLFGDVAPEGAILNAPLMRGTADSRDPDEALRAGLYRCMLDLTYMIQGICRECTGHVTGTLTICEEHEAGGDTACQHCGTPFRGWGELRCDTCRFAKRLPMEICVLGLPTVIGFLYARDVEVLDPSLEGIVDVLAANVRTSCSVDPPRLTARIEVEGDALTLVIDRDLNVVEVTQDRPQ